MTEVIDDVEAAREDRAVADRKDGVEVVDSRKGARREEARQLDRENDAHPPRDRNHEEVVKKEREKSREREREHGADGETLETFVEFPKPVRAIGERNGRLGPVLRRIAVFADKKGRSFLADGKAAAFEKFRHEQFAVFRAIQRDVHDSDTPVYSRWRWPASRDWLSRLRPPSRARNTR